MKKYGITGNASGFIRSSELVTAYLSANATQTKKSQPLSNIATTTPKKQEPLSLMQDQMIDTIALMQAIKKENTPLARQGQAKQMLEIESSLNDPELIDTMQEFVPIQGLGLSKKHTLLSLTDFQMKGIEKEIAKVDDTKLRIILYGLNFQIYNLIDMLAKYIPPKQAKGSLLEALPTIKAEKIEKIIARIEKTRQITIEEFKKRGLAENPWFPMAKKESKP